MTDVKLSLRGLRGESFADVARRLGTVGGIAINPNLTDQQIMNLLINAAEDDADRAEAAATSAAADLADMLAVVALGDDAAAIAARVPKNTDGSDFTQPDDVRGALGAAPAAIVGISIGDAGTPDGPNNTAAFDAAIVTGGARPHFPQGTWYGNFQTSETNVVIVGMGGDSEAAGGGGEVLRPYDDTLPTVQFGGDGALCFGNGVRDLAISGYNADTATQAPEAYLLAGGVVNSFSSHFTITDGVHSLSLQPSDNLPVTCAFFDNFHIRNGLDVAGARAIYLNRPADVDEYLTSISFSNGHVNGPTDGYLMEIDGGANGIAASFVNVYMDYEPDHHVLLKGPSLILGFNLQIDPDQTDAVVVETDSTSLDPTTIFAGLVRVEGNKMRNSLAAEHTFASDWFMRKPYITDMLFYGQLNFTTLANRARQTHYLAKVSDDGALGVYGMGLSVQDTTDSSSTANGSFTTLGGAGVAKKLRVGTDAHIGGSLFVGATQFSEISPGFGVRFDSGGQFRFLPTGATLFAGTGVLPDSDGVQVCGANANAFASGNFKRVDMDAATVINTSRHFMLRAYTVGTLPAAGTAGGTIYVSDETGGQVPAFSDGTNWRRVTDRAIVA